MKRPSFQFYPGDWQANSNLRRCSHEERGIWIDVLCLLHDQEEYGLVRWPLKEIAQAVSCTPTKLQGLVTKGILKGSDTELKEPFIYIPRSGRKDGEPITLVPAQTGPVWYSSRMVKDEYVRTIRGESSRFGAENGVAPKAAPKPPIGDGSSSSSSSSTSKKGEDKSSPQSGKARRFSDEDMRLAEFMLERIQQAMPEFKARNLDPWANTIRLMRERDDLTHRRIAEVFDWANRDSFWKTNILSPDKLREKFPQLAAKLEDARGKRDKPAGSTASEKLESNLDAVFGSPGGSGVVLEGDFERVGEHASAH